MVVRLDMSKSKVRGRGRGKGGSRGKQYPEHWGTPPRIQTRDLRPLPGGYGRGSSTLCGWIQRHMDQDESVRAKAAAASQAALRELFAAVDVDGDGRITQSEFHKAMTGKRKEQLRPLLDGASYGPPYGLGWRMVLNRIDKDFNGQVSFDEFAAAFIGSEVVHQAAEAVNEQLPAPENPSGSDLVARTQGFIAEAERFEAKMRQQYRSEAAAAEH